MSRRKKLPTRRPTWTDSFEHDGQKFHVTVGYYDESLQRAGELFVNSSQKRGSHTDLAVSEAAIAVSIALQHGVPLRTLRAACLRDARGNPQTPVGRALDLMDDEKPLDRKKVKLA